MLVNIDYHDSRPIYEQISEGFKKLILSGVLTADEQMPSVRSLAMELSTNPNTVQKAFAELEREGFIYSIKGRGSFVKADSGRVDIRKTRILEAIDALIREAEEIGITRETILNSLRERGVNDK